MPSGNGSGWKRLPDGSWVAETEEEDAEFRYPLEWSVFLPRLLAVLAGIAAVVGVGIIALGVAEGLREAIGTCIVSLPHPTPSGPPPR